MPGGRKIYIIGFMGSGKTTAGKKLAAVLGWPFIDLDKKIEEKAGKSIPELFSEDGEEYFRGIESETLKSFENCSDAVIASGGGTPCYADNMDYMLATGLTVYLKLTPSQLCSRLSESGGERPLIKNLGKAELLAFIEEKLYYRERWYNRAEINIEGFDIDVKNLSSVIKAALNNSR
jgi:shikimate kinase